jgi:hypothetical protein
MRKTLLVLATGAACALSVAGLSPARITTTVWTAARSSGQEVPPRTRVARSAANSPSARKPPPFSGRHASRMPPQTHGGRSSLPAGNRSPETALPSAAAAVGQSGAEAGLSGGQTETPDRP